ncbi:MAG: PAS domain-containing protein [Planctomycetaceae bacterium]|nr:PAS domain-containing protein [Planctomycetaceae bacterium]
MINPNETPRPARAAAVRQTILVGCLLSLVLLLIVGQRRLALASAIRDQLQGRVDLHARFLQASVELMIEDHRALNRFVQEQLNDHGAIRADEFATFSAGLHADSRWIRAFQVVENGVIQFNYPMAGNELVVGYDLMQHPDPVIRRDLVRSEESGTLVICGPVRLVQGTQGLILRQRVPGEAGIRRVVAVVVDLEQLLQVSGITAETDEGLTLSVCDDQGRTIVGGPIDKRTQPVTQRVDLRDQLWTLSVIPQGGWSSRYRSQLVGTAAAGILIILLATALTWMVSSRHAALAEAVASGTSELNEANNNLQRDVFLRIQTEDALRQAMGRLRSMFDQAAVGLAVIDAGTGAIAEYNRYLTNLLHCSPSLLLGKPLAGFIDSSTLMEFEELVQQLVDGRVSEFTLEQQWWKENGDPVWVSLTATPMWARAESPTTWLAIVQDCTDRHHSETELQRRDAILNAIASIAPGVVNAADMTSLLKVVCHQLGTATDVSRTSFLEYYQDAGGAWLANQLVEWTAAGIEPQIDNPELRDFDPVSSGFSRWVTLLSSHRIVSGIVRTFPDSERSLLETLGVLSVAAIPVFVHGRLRGVLCVDECRRDREWGLPETNALRLAGDLISAAWERKEAEAERQADEQRFRTVFEEAGDGLVVVDRLGAVVSANKRAFRILHLGGDAGDLRRIRVSDWPEKCRIWTEHSAGDSESGRLISAEQQPPQRSAAAVRYRRVECRLPLPDGDSVPVTLSAGQLDDNLSLLVLHDLTESYEARDALRQQKERMQIMADALPLIVQYVDREQRMAYVNQTALQWYESGRGAYGGEIVGLRLNEFLPTDLYETVRPFVEKALCGHAVEFPLTLKTRSGQPGHRHFIFAPHRDDDGAVQGFYILISDVTERVEADRKEAELREQLAKSQKLEAIGRLAGGVAHDFNNMLQVILGYSEIALAEARPDSPLAGYLVEVRKAAKRSAALTQQLLAFSRRQVVTPTVVNLAEQVPQCLKMISQLVRDDIRIEWECGPDPGNILIDPMQIDHLLANLAVNARDSIAASGVICISVRNIESDEARLLFDDGSGHAVTEETYVLLSVRDNGSGMDEVTRQRIYEPFFTTKEVGKGCGLGLSMVYGIVTQNHGLIEVHSRPGVGTTVYVAFPGVPEASDPSGGSSEARSQGRGECILIVEDEPMVLELAHSLLKKMGYVVVSARTAAEAIRTVSTTMTHIDLMITDIVMPGMGGAELARRLRQIQPDLKVLMISGYAALHTDELEQSETAFEILRKPFTAAELAERIRQILNGDPVDRLSHDTSVVAGPQMRQSGDP